MFVLSVGEDVSTVDALKLLAWVYEGSIQKGDIITCLASLRVTSYGWTEDSETQLSYKIKDIQPVEIKVNKIEKVGEWQSIDSGYSGAFYLEAVSDECDSFLRSLLEDNEFQTESVRQQATHEQPVEQAEILLFDSRSTADAYLEALPQR
ncbi:hypothetical protein [Deinococcus sp. AJ005]|uniref:hypothetical protein n=1 Tax=Deinococcus sp. AJ005 TaxID=2652443 RepID=UPI00125CD263|nr:hypothetical protein [Deinococcus sp. AJ005]QFP76338.1 hypothetical protein DAAJ005_07635 [Deinococcus sp. AJ005]